MFCVECGKDGKTYEGLCVSCFFGKKKVAEVRDTVDLSVCTLCGRVLVGRDWREESLDDCLRDLLPRRMEVHHLLSVRGMDIELKPLDTRNVRATVSARLVLGDEEVVVPVQARVRLRQITCPRCSKRQGSYYEAILQVRPSSKSMDPGTMDRIRDFVRSRVGSMSDAEGGAFISKEEEVGGGLDFYISSNRAGQAVARELARMFRATVKSSPKIYGTVRGKDVYRVTYSVRLP